jgi:hypothetical protein
MRRKLHLISLILANLGATAHAEVVNPTISYELPTDSTVIVGLGFTSISVRGQGAEDSGQTIVENCAFSGLDAGRFSVSPSVLTLSTTTTSRSLALRCTNAPPSVDVIATLTCEETANPGNGDVRTNRSWQVLCSSFIFETSADLIFAPNLGRNIRLNGPTNVGATATLPLNVQVRSGFMPPSPISISNCQITGPGASAFQAPTSGILFTFPLTNGNIAVQCTRGMTVANATLSCLKTLGQNSSTVSWPLICPAGDDRLFVNGFEDGVVVSRMAD